MKRYCPRCFSRFDRDLERCPEDGEKLVLISDDDLVGKTLDERYAILSKLGEGGMGTVYVAEQAIIGRRVALKVLRGAMVQDESSVKRFLTEARAIATLKSPHTITLHDFGVTREGQLYYTMELLEGSPLSTLIALEAPMDPARAARLLLQGCKSLQEAHDKGILHRDIKPDNMFVTWGNEGEHVTVLDFGIAKLGEDSMMGTITKTGMLCGTPAYLSPEQAQGSAAVPASDLYAMAIVFYEMLAGEPPFSDTTAMRVLIKHVTDTPAPLSVKNPRVQVPGSIEEFILKGLSKKPEDRFTSVRDFREGLERALVDADRSSATATMPPLATGVGGVRAIATPAAPPTVDRSEAINPMAHTLGSSQALAVSAPRTQPAARTPDRVSPSGATAHPEQPRSPSRPAGGAEHTSTGPEVGFPVVGHGGSRAGLWATVLGGIVVAAALGVWRPWEAASDRSSAASTTAERAADEAPGRAGSRGVTADRGATEITTAVPSAPVGEPGPGESAGGATVPPTPDAVSRADSRAELAGAVLAPAPGAGSDVAGAPTPDAGSTADAALDERNALLTAEEHAAAKKGAEAAAAKKAAEAAAAKKAADAAAAKKAADAAAAKKAADAAAAQKAADAAAKKAADAAAAKKAAEAAATAKPALGFRKVTVEEPPTSQPGDKVGGGLGFRKVEVEKR